MRLWQKESNGEKACYMDVLYNNNHLHEEAVYLFHELRLDNAKSDSKSILLRYDGNAKFKEGAFRQAIELYNRSFRYAIIPSKNVGLLCANRALCFLKLGKYDECLADIALARKSEYADHVKLRQREVDCLKQMKQSKEVTKTVKPGLSIKAHKKYPCMSNVLEIQSNEKFGRHIVTKAKLEVGQLILVEDAFLFESLNQDRTACETCLKVMTNFIPCPLCTDAMFCTDYCMKHNDIHKIGCGAAYRRRGTKMYKSTIESVLFAVNAFSNNTDELMKFVENFLESRDFGMLKGMSAARYQYGQFLNLAAVRKDLDEKYLLRAHQLLMRIPLIVRLFTSKEKKRFLMHLMLQHVLILETNSIIYGRTGTVHALGNFMSLFNHACYPNVGTTLCENRIVCYVIRPIDKDQQLFITYKPSIHNLPSDERKIFLWNGYRFKCYCAICVPCLKPVNQLKMHKDKDFSILSERIPDDFLTNETLRVAYESKSRRFLAKFGTSSWSLEISLALVILQKCINYRLKDFESS